MNGGTIMWIEKTPTGRYKYIERYKSTLTGDYRRVSVTYGKKTPQVVKAATRELERKIKDALSQEGKVVKDITLEELSKDYLAQYKQRVQPTTYQLGELAVNLFVNGVGKKTLVKNITLNRLNRYFNDVLYKHNNTNNTARVYRGKVRAMFSYAVTYGYLKENLVTQVTINWKNEANRIRNRIENKYLTYEEYTKIINMFYDRHMDHYADIFKLQYLTGLRFGEAAGLQVKDVIHEGKRTYLDINHTLGVLSSPVRYYLSTSTKTFAGLRKIVLSPEAAEIVNSHCIGKADNALLFAYNPSATSFSEQRPVNINSANMSLKRLVPQLGITKDVTTHIFRHTHVSVLADMGIPLRVISARVGHSNGDITEHIYLHVTERTKKKYEDEIANIDTFK